MFWEYVGSHSHRHAALEHPNSHLHLQAYMAPCTKGTLHPSSSWPWLHLQENLHTSMGQSSAWWLDSKCTIKVITLICCPGILIDLGLFMRERTAFIFSSQLHITSLLPEYAFSLPLNLCQGMQFKKYFYLSIPFTVRFSLMFASEFRREFFFLLLDHP